jgi:hypothetical protein
MPAPSADTQRTTPAIPSIVEGLIVTGWPTFNVEQG